MQQTFIRNTSLSSFFEIKLTAGKDIKPRREFFSELFTLLSVCLTLFSVPWESKSLSGSLCVIWHYDTNNFDLDADSHQCVSASHCPGPNCPSWPYRGPDGIGGSICYWPDGVLKYQISSSFDREEGNIIRRAVPHLEKKLKGCVRFVEKRQWRQVYITNFRQFWGAQKTLCHTGASLDDSC